MKKLIAVFLVLIVAFGIWWLFFNGKSGTGKTKKEPYKVLSHSGSFNKSVDDVMNSYFMITAAFVSTDTAKAKMESRKFITLLDGIKTDDLKGDNPAIFASVIGQIGDIRTNATAMLSETDLTEMRQDLRMISENLYPFLKTIKYEGPALYWQNCPMAFGEEKEGNWISSTKEIVNPYLGKNHPVYKSSMLHCGEIKDTIK